MDTEIQRDYVHCHACQQYYDERDVVIQDVTRFDRPAQIGMEQHVIKFMCPLGHMGQVSLRQQQSIVVPENA